LKVEDEVRIEGFERRDKPIPDSLRQRFSSVIAEIEIECRPKVV
jgi:hypothetical protein